LTSCDISGSLTKSLPGPLVMIMYMLPVQHSHLV